MELIARMHLAVEQVKDAARSERGATAVEYGIMIALIAFVIIGVVAALGGNLFDKFDAVNTEVENATTGAPGGGGTP